jgi:hypothetical protein
MTGKQIHSIFQLTISVVQSINQPFSLQIHVRMLSGLKTCTVSILQLWYNQVLSQRVLKNLYEKQDTGIQHFSDTSYVFF